jgi:adenine-specific DNA-methyltransferase
VSLENRKRLGQVFTPEDVASWLVRWATSGRNRVLLDPSCGDGRFLACHRACVGVEMDAGSAEAARARAPWATVHTADFFEWALQTNVRFEAAAGNPPFIRYQHFSGLTRDRALEAAARVGGRLTGLTSAWAPFLVVTAGLLKRGGRMAFVVPAEIGHAPYAAPAIEVLCSHFHTVHIVAIREKLFPDLSEDAWLLLAHGFGGHTDAIEFSAVERFTAFESAARSTKRITLASWRATGCRLRRFLLPDQAFEVYREMVSCSGVKRLGELTRTGIGYVTGANDFFHLRPSEVRRLGLPASMLRVSVRRGKQLPSVTVDTEVVARWLRDDEPVMLLDLKGVGKPPLSVTRYLDSEAGQRVRNAYKCRNRRPWYAVPDVRVPDAFLTYMSGRRPALVRNDAGCVCTNSVHGVSVRPGVDVDTLQSAWHHPLAELSCELEGHPLGGGMLKLEPREAANVAIPCGTLALTRAQLDVLTKATAHMRRWRNYV